MITNNQQQNPGKSFFFLESVNNTFSEITSFSLLLLPLSIPLSPFIPTRPSRFISSFWPSIRTIQRLKQRSFLGHTQELPYWSEVRGLSLLCRANPAKNPTVWDKLFNSTYPGDCLISVWLHVIMESTDWHKALTGSESALGTTSCPPPAWLIT